MSPTETLTFERKNAKETGPEQNTWIAIHATTTFENL